MYSLILISVLHRLAGCGANTIGPVLNVWGFLAYFVNSMIVGQLCMVLLLDFIIAFQLIANPRKTRISHLTDTRNQNQSYTVVQLCRSS